MTTATTQRNAFSFETKSRSSSDEIDSIGSFGAGLRVEKIGQGPCRNLRLQGGKSSPEIDLQSGSLTPSPEDLKEEQTFHGHGILKICKCITNDFALNQDSFQICMSFPFGMDP